MGMEIDAVVGHPGGDEVGRVPGPAEAVGGPVTVTFRWEGREEAERAVLVPAATPALWQHWAPTACPTSDAGHGDGAVAQEPDLAHPAEFAGASWIRGRRRRSRSSPPGR